MSLPPSSLSVVLATSWRHSTHRTHRTLARDHGYDHHCDDCPAPRLPRVRPPDPSPLLVLPPHALLQHQLPHRGAPELLVTTLRGPRADSHAPQLAATHPWVCSQPADSFTFPPLTATEKRQLETAYESNNVQLKDVWTKSAEVMHEHGWDWDQYPVRLSSLPSLPTMTIFTAR